MTSPKALPEGNGFRLSVVVLMFSACAPTVEAGPIVTPEAWQRAADDDDPFMEHRPATYGCADGGWGVEDGELEIDTGACAYLSIEQPVLLDVPAGATIGVRLFHQPLHADDDAVGHAALAVDGVVLWERSVRIPGPANAYDDEVMAPRAIVAGERVVFHLHNHGANTWRLGDVSVSP
jgi:hypothetical protein